LKYVKCLDEVGRTSNFAKPPTVDFYDTTGTVQTGQRPVGDQPKIWIVAAHHKCIGLNGVKSVHEHQLGGVPRFTGQPDQDDAIRCVGGCLPRPSIRRNGL